MGPLFVLEQTPAIKVSTFNAMSKPRANSKLLRVKSRVVEVSYINSINVFQMQIPSSSGEQFPIGREHGSCSSGTKKTILIPHAPHAGRNCMRRTEPTIDIV